MSEVSSLDSLFSRAEEMHRRDVANFKPSKTSVLLDEYLKTTKTRAQSINGDIYFRIFLRTCKTEASAKYEADKRARIRELFSVPEFHEKDIRYLDSDYIANVLVDDAIKNNTRDDLPYFLQALYDEKVCKY